jgi:hypothetical protein
MQGKKSPLGGAAMQHKRGFCVFIQALNSRTILSSSFFLPFYVAS